MTEKSGRRDQFWSIMHGQIFMGRHRKHFLEKRVSSFVGHSQMCPTKKLRSRIFCASSRASRSYTGGCLTSKKLHSRIFGASSGASRPKSCSLGFLVLQQVLHDQKVALSDSDEAPSEAPVRDCKFLLMKHHLKHQKSETATFWSWSTTWSTKNPRVQLLSPSVYDLEAPLEAPKIRECNFLPRCVPHNWACPFF